VIDTICNEERWRNGERMGGDCFSNTTHRHRLMKHRTAVEKEGLLLG